MFFKKTSIVVLAGTSPITCFSGDVPKETFDCCFREDDFCWLCETTALTLKAVKLRKKVRYSVWAGFAADFIGVIAAIIIGYIFFK